MPCDSVATISTRISQETFNKALTPQVLLELLPDFLKTQDQKIVYSHAGSGLSVETEHYQIYIQQSEIRVTRRLARAYDRPQVQKMTDTFKDTLSEFVKTASLNAVRAKIAMTVKGVSSQMSSPVFAPNGAMIIDFNMKGG